MEPMTILAIAGSVMSAGLVYVVLHVRFFGEKQAVSDQLLKAQTEITQLKKTLKGYTHYRECLEAGKHALTEYLKPPVAKLVRPYVHVEPIAKADFKLDQDVTVIIKYEVEFSFSIDPSSAGLEIWDAENGVGLKISHPILVGEPNIKTLSQKIVSSKPVADEKPLFAHAHKKFVLLAQRYGTAMGTEEALRALCKLKALECLRDALSKQSGVKQVGSVFVDFK